MDYFVKFIKKILEIKSPSKFKDLVLPTYPNYVEKDTKCDLCDDRNECEDYLIDCTHSFDTRRHLINSIDYICPKIRPCGISCNGDFMIDDDPCKCDKCGKYYDKNKGVKIINGCFVKGIRLETSGPYMILDLCDSCISELYTFLGFR